MLQLKGDQSKQDIQGQQLREMLAKEVKQRQNRKKMEQERMMRESGQMPLRHWPPDNVGPSPGKSFQDYTARQVSRVHEFCILTFFRYILMLQRDSLAAGNVLTKSEYGPIIVGCCGYFCMI